MSLSFPHDDSFTSVSVRVDKPNSVAFFQGISDRNAYFNAARIRRLRVISFKPDDSPAIHADEIAQLDLIKVEQSAGGTDHSAGGDLL
jgi:hypothetical protein